MDKDEHSDDLDHSPIAINSGGKSGRLLKTGDIIGETYRLKGLIGRGGMGFVFRAEHLLMRQDYALKILAPDQVNESSWQRFQSEGRAIARLEHPNIVKIYNMGVDSGDCPYYAMDLLDGISLADCLQDQLPLSLAEILDIFIQLANGFGYAHSRGIVHRDVKPANIILVDTGKAYPTAKIVDFGIAKLAGVSDQNGQSMTATGEICGSPLYMSPEQCMGNEIDLRSDVYSLGCTLFETLTGQPPFRGESALHTVMMHQTAEPPSLASVSDKYSSVELEAIVAKMLAKKPADRYQSMDQLVHDLERVRANKAVGKNVETGFRSSVDNQLDELEERYDGANKNLLLRNILVGVAILSVVVLVGTVGSRMFMIAAKPAVSAPRAHTRSGWINLHQAQKEQKPDVELINKSKVLDSVAAITSSIDAKTGQRIFHCPPSGVGFFTWFANHKNVAGIDTDDRDDGMVKAKGDTPVPPGVGIMLSLERGYDRVIWSDPTVLKRFGPHELVGIKLCTENYTENFLTDKELAEQDEQITNLVKATEGWADFDFIYFYKVHAPAAAFEALEKHKNTLKQLLIQETTADARVVARCQFLKNLANLTVVNLNDLDIVLEAMKGSTCLVNVEFRGSPVTAVGLRALSSCPKLTVMRIEQSALDHDSLEAIARTRNLRRLDLTRCLIKPADLPSVAKLAFIEKVHVNLHGWSNAEKQQLKTLAPNINHVGFY